MLCVDGLAFTHSLSVRLFVVVVVELEFPSPPTLPLLAVSSPWSGFRAINSFHLRGWYSFRFPFTSYSACRPFSVHCRSLFFYGAQKPRPPVLFTWKLENSTERIGLSFLFLIKRFLLCVAVARRGLCRLVTPNVRSSNFSLEKTSLQVFLFLAGKLFTIFNAISSKWPTSASTKS